MANILIVRYNRLGDALIALPIIYGLANNYKEDTFTVISNGRFSPIFDQMPNNVIYLAMPYKRPMGLLRSPIYVIRRQLFYWKVKRHCKKIDKVAILQWESFEKKIYEKILSKKNIPIEIIDESVLSTEKRLLGKCSDGLKVTDLELAILANLGYKKIEPKFDPSFLKQKDVYDLSKKLDLDMNKKTIAIAPFSYKQTKTYPLSKMELIVAYFIQNRPDCQVLLMGAGDKEEVIATDWIRKYPSLISLVNKFSFEEEIFLIAHANVALTMDSANLHLASLLDIPVISIWGGTTPACGYYPPKETLNNAIYLGLNCQPCNVTGLDNCGNKTPYNCFNIDINLILDKVESYL